MKRATSPGKKGRLKALGQGRTATGQFTKAKPKPIQEHDIAALAARRKEALERASQWRPTSEEWDLVTTEARALLLAGHSPDTIAAVLDLPEHTIRRAIARGAELAEVGEDPLTTKQWGAVSLITIIERALAADEYEEARKAVYNLLQLEGHIAQGQGVAVGIQVKSEKEISVDVQEWLNKQEEDEDDEGSQPNARAAMARGDEANGGETTAGESSD